MILVQLTDLHLGTTAWSDGRSNADRLRETISFVNEVRPDLVLITGDLVEADVVQQGVESYYEDLRTILAGIRSQWTLIPGNHDNPVALRKVFPELPREPGDLFHTSVHIGARVTAIGLDTVFPGSVNGGVDDQRLAWLEDTLRRLARPVVLFMHHPPIEACDIPQDLSEDVHRMIVSHLATAGLFRGVRRLYALLAEVPCVSLIMSGHSHVGFETIREGIPVTIGPAIAPPSRQLLALRPSSKQDRLVASARPGCTIVRIDAAGKLKHDFVFIQ